MENESFKNLGRIIFVDYDFNSNVSVHILNSKRPVCQASWTLIWDRIRVVTWQNQVFGCIVDIHRYLPEKLGCENEMVLDGILLNLLG